MSFRICCVKTSRSSVFSPSGSPRFARPGMTGKHYLARWKPKAEGHELSITLAWLQICGRRGLRRRLRNRWVRNAAWVRELRRLVHPQPLLRREKRRPGNCVRGTIVHLGVREPKSGNGTHKAAVAPLPNSALRIRCRFVVEFLSKHMRKSLSCPNDHLHGCGSSVAGLCGSFFDSVNLDNDVTLRRVAALVRD